MTQIFLSIMLGAPSMQLAVHTELHLYLQLHNFIIMPFPLTLTNEIPSKYIEWTYIKNQ